MRFRVLTGHTPPRSPHGPPRPPLGTVRYSTSKYSTNCNCRTEILVDQSVVRTPPLELAPTSGRQSSRRRVPLPSPHSTSAPGIRRELREPMSRGIRLDGDPNTTSTPSRRSACPSVGRSTLSMDYTNVLLSDRMWSIVCEGEYSHVGQVGSLAPGIDLVALTPTTLHTRVCPRAPTATRTATDCSQVFIHINRRRQDEHRGVRVWSSCAALAGSIVTSQFQLEFGNSLRYEAD